jgi:hypothetical protein
LRDYVIWHRFSYGVSFVVVRPAWAIGWKG